MTVVPLLPISHATAEDGALQSACWGRQMTITDHWFKVLLVAMWLVGWSSGIPSRVSAAEGPAQQIILKWRDALPEKERAAITAGVLREAGARHGVSLEYLRSTAVGGSIYKPSRALSREEMADLIRTLAADPNVEYVEEDGLMRPMPRS
jgi:hypothetical protein